MELPAAGCCEFPKLNIIQKAIKCTCEKSAVWWDVDSAFENSLPTSKGTGRKCMAACSHPPPPHPCMKAGCWNEGDSLRRGLVLLWFLSPSAVSWRSLCGGRTKLFVMDGNSNPPPAPYSCSLRGAFRWTFHLTCRLIWHFPWPNVFPHT